jgi:hypothetical protein
MLLKIVLIKIIFNWKYIKILFFIFHKSIKIIKNTYKNINLIFFQIKSILKNKSIHLVFFFYLLILKFESW